MRLPRSILLYPMTLVSQAAHLVMLFQQNVAELVIKGDATLEMLFPPKEEQPAWATFDEDLVEFSDTAPSQFSSTDPIDNDRRAEGRFALYSISGPAELGTFGTEPATGRHGTDSASQPHTEMAPPTVAVALDYPTLTLAQLRPRLQSLDVDELQTLLAYEQATSARPPFETLIANRITRATAK